MRWSPGSLSPKNVFVKARVLLALAAALVIFPAATVIAQDGPFPEGSLVQAPDGSLYVFEGGQYHRIRPATANPQQLSAAPQGDPVVNGVFIIPPAGPPPPPCGENFEIRVCVLGVQRPYQAGSFTPNTGNEFVLVRLRIENVGSEQTYIASPIVAFRVQDANGSQRDWGSSGNTPNVPEALDGTNLVPGAAIEGNAIIAVPTDTARLTKVIWVLQASPFQAVEAPIP